MCSKVSRGFLCTCLKSSNVPHFGMVETTGLNMWRDVTSSVTISVHFIRIHQSVQNLHPTKMFTRPAFWNGWSYGIKKVALRSWSVSSPAMKIHLLVQKLLGGNTHREIDGRTERQASDLFFMKVGWSISRDTHIFLRCPRLFKYALLLAQYR
jgi:hypothetical protein